MDANRPTSVTVFGILNIVWGALGLCGPSALLITLRVRTMMENPVMTVMTDDPLLYGWLIGSQILGLIAAIVLVAAGIGLLGLKPWARTASIVYAIYAIVGVALGTIINLTVVFPRVAELVQQAPAPRGAGMMGGMVGGTCGGVVWLAYPILLLIFMTRPKVVAAFRK